LAMIVSVLVAIATPLLRVRERNQNLH